MFSVSFSLCNARAEWVAGWVFLEGTCRGQWERRGTAFDVFPSSSLIFVLYCESWVREEAGES